MKYESTRGRARKIQSAHVIRSGIAPDGGLYVPVRLPHIDYFRYMEMSYQERAYNVLRAFLTDFEECEILECIENAYNAENFDVPGVVEKVKLNGNMDILELWHGPTYAFKDIALQILPHIFSRALEKTGEKKKALILTATSGDTGKAALEGFRDVAGTEVVVFYPKDGVSQVQALQMMTQDGGNVSVVKVDGNFDDVQNAVKNVFADEEIRALAEKKGYIFSSANSINWGRLVPQIVYYISAYADMVRDGTIEDGEKINICVPTGNFGNILAAYYAREMGLPVNRLICASNKNNILTEFINSGTYDTNRDFFRTVSPSMDILISSNLERLLYELAGRDPKLLNSWVEGLAKEGRYEVDEKTKKKMTGLFFAGFSNDEETLGTIDDIYKKFGYLADPHTAVAIDVYDKYVVSTLDLSKTLIVSTANPFKFGKTVAKAIMGNEKLRGMKEPEIMDMLSREAGCAIPEGLRDLDRKEILHDRTCLKSEIPEYVKEYIMRKGDGSSV